tara:strand:- start:609 stop:854 length:246 start_codon:yes stop_codon:yes gene_type:complete
MEEKAIGTYWMKPESIWGPYKIITYDVSEYSSYPKGEGAHVVYSNPKFGNGKLYPRIVISLKSVEESLESSEDEYLLWSIR